MLSTRNTCHASHKCLDNYCSNDVVLCLFADSQVVLCEWSPVRCAHPSNISHRLGSPHNMILIDPFLHLQEKDIPVTNTYDRVQTARGVKARVAYVRLPSKRRPVNEIVRRVSPKGMLHVTMLRSHAAFWSHTDLNYCSL